TSSNAMPRTGGLPPRRPRLRRPRDRRPIAGCWRASTRSSPPCGSRGPPTTSPRASAPSWTSSARICRAGTCAAPGRATDPVALETLHEALVSATRLLAPAAPFIADWVHRALTGTSVHLAPFPVDRGRREPELLQAMDTVRRLASLARAAREAKNIRVRQPLA